MLLLFLLLILAWDTVNQCPPPLPPLTKLLFKSWNQRFAKMTCGPYPSFYLSICLSTCNTLAIIIHKNHLFVWFKYLFIPLPKNKKKLANQPTNKQTVQGGLDKPNKSEKKKGKQTQVKRKEITKNNYENFCL